MEYSNDTPGQLWVGMVDPNGMSGDGPLALVVFRVLSRAGTPTPLEIEGVEAYNTNTLMDVLTTVSAGSIVSEDGSYEAPTVSFSRQQVR